jgi:hypothetical protein
MTNLFYAELFKHSRDEMYSALPKPVMRGLDPRIHAFTTLNKEKTWMAGSSPAMTSGEKKQK